MTMEKALPEGWVECSIADVANINPKNQAEPETLSGFVPMSHAPTDFKKTLKFEEKPWGDIKKSYTNFRDGDVIFAKVTPCFENGKAAIVKGLPNGIGAGSSEFYVLRAITNEVLPELLFALIKTREFAQQGAANMTGAVGLRRVPRAFVGDYALPLPPLAEQQVIADKLDALLAQVETTKTRLERVPETIKRFRQSVLAAAVSGKLTEEWRGGRQEDSWETVNLGNIISEMSQGWSPKCLNEPTQGNDWGVIKTSSVQEIEFLENENKKLPPALEARPKLIVKPGDILTTRAGPRSRCGVTCYVSSVSKKLMICDKVYRYRVKPEFGLNKYLATMLNDVSVLETIENLKTGISESGMNLTQAKFKALELFWPPLPEQQEIVRRVEELFAHADAVEQQAKAALEKVNNLTQSILAKAFRGELTADWRAANPELISGENSAEALLARIKEERAAQKPKKRATTRRKKKAVSD